ncbi:AAA family ATPase [Kineococcus endophyticus]|uniref:AAA family ATPase n=1 Tax=Kineococcus endophyticus TaxID=1181883 RepID=A0ABV3P1Z1_9ACTN
MLIVLSGLPGSGKTSLARALVTAARAVHVRLDTVEQALVDAGTATHPVGPVGHHVARAVAGDLLRQGHLVVADGVNPLPVTRELWWDVARAADRPWLDVEVVCGDTVLHRRRVQDRVADIPGHPEPTWADVERVEFTPWTTDRVRVDLGRLSPAEAAAGVLSRAQSSQTMPTLPPTPESATE